MIPKKIHLAWKTKTFLDTLLNIVQHGARSLKDLNPSWVFEISDDADIELYLQQNLAAADYSRLADRHIVEKCDVWRLLKMINEGGLYADIDRYCNQVLDDLIPTTVSCVLPMHYDIDFAQDIMLSCPNHDIHKKALALNLERRKEGCTDVLSMGPITYFHAATAVLLGAPVERWPPADVLQRLRTLINEDPAFMTYREEPPWNTFLYRGPALADDKAAFYAHSQISHWTATPGTVNDKKYGK